MFAVTAILLSMLPAQATASFVIEADRVWLGDGTVLEKGRIWIEGDKIRAVGAQVDAPDGTPVFVHAGSASAGIVALHGYAGASGDLRDSTRPLMPEAEAGLAFSPRHAEFEDLVHAGVTSLLLAPTSQSLCGGTTAVVKTASGKVVKRRAHLCLSFSADALSSNRSPTSASGALAELDRAFEEPKGAFAEARSGRLPVIFEVDTRADVQRATAFATRRQLKGAVFGADWAGELADTLREAKLAVIAGPFDAGVSPRTLDAVKKLAKAGIPFAFGLDAPWRDPAALRFSAALCVRDGVAPAVAWKALSQGAAEIAGVGDRVGNLARGLDADVVLWSGDPLELSSAVDAVFIDGARVYGGER